jgi:hypothetical protein
MRLILYKCGKRLMDITNTSKNMNKIPNSFEKLATQLPCPKCKSNTLIECKGYIPSIDVICSHRDCRHSIEVKSILAEGSQKNAYTPGEIINIKLGSVNTYKNIRKVNKSLLLCWYNIIIDDDTEIYKINVRDCILMPMSEFNDGKNCKTTIVLQKKKTKYKKRLKLEIFPEFSVYFSKLSKDDFNLKNSLYSYRQYISNFLVFFSKLLRNVKKMSIIDKHPISHMNVNQKILKYIYSTLYNK